MPYVVSLAVRMGMQPVCGPKVHGIISGSEGLIAGIKSGEGRPNR